MTNNTKKTFQLPSHIISTTDLGRVIRELESLEEAHYQAKLGGQAKRPTPGASRLLNELADANGISIENSSSRKHLLDLVKGLSEKAPTMHMSFAVEPTPLFMQKIVEWARQHLHTYLLIDVGLQPSVVVGCKVRTTNKVFDMSLGNRFRENRKLLLEKLVEKAEAEK